MPSLHKSILIILFLLTSVSNSFSQEISREEMLPIFKNLGSESWFEAYTMSKTLLAKYEGDTTSGFVELLRYITLFSGAGSVSDGKLTYEKFGKYAKTLIGKPLKMAGHPTTLDTGEYQVRFNTNELKMEHDSVKGFCTATNKAKTSIYCFEEYQFPYTSADTSEMEISTMEGKSTRWGGVLANIELNPNKSKIWISRLYIKDAWIHGFIPTDASPANPETKREKINSAPQTPTDTMRVMRKK